MVAIGSYSVATFRMVFGLAFAVYPGFGLGSDPLPVAGQPVAPARGRHLQCLLGIATPEIWMYSLAHVQR